MESNQRRFQAAPKTKSPIAWAGDMGNTDFPIHEWWHRRGEAIKDLRVWETGPRWFRAGEDVTASQIARATRTIEQMDILIAECEARNALRRAGHSIEIKVATERA